MPSTLPRWTDRPGHSKIEPLTGPGRGPEQLIREWLDEHPGRVLDVGAGRGETVSWLLADERDAAGVEPDWRYVENGVGLLGDRLQVMGRDGSYPFADGEFDVVMSNQVLEHVADLDLFAAEVARVTRPGGVGVHVFPARWKPVEGHMRTPLVHLLPKGPLRHAGIRAALTVGAAAPHFRELSTADRAEVFNRFSTDETFYRPLHQIREAFAVHHLVCEFDDLPTRKLTARGLPAVTARAYRQLKMVYMTTVRV